MLFKGLHASRRRAEIKEQEYRRSEGRYRRLIETAGQGIWVVDEHGLTSYANPRLGEILGIPPARLIGRPLSEFLVDDDASWSGSEAQPDPFAWHEIRLRGGDGGVRHVILTSQAVGADLVPGDVSDSSKNATGGLLLMVTDVTPLKRAEEALREKESVLRSFYDSSVMAMGVVELSDNDTRFVSANALSDKFFGVETGTLEGKSARQLKAPPEMLATWTDRFRECRVTGRPVRFEYQGLSQSSPEWVAATLSPMDSLRLGARSLLVHRRRHHRPQAHRGRPSRGQRGGRGGVARQGSLSRRAQPRAPNAADPGVDRRRVAPGIQSPTRRSCRPSR